MKIACFGVIKLIFHFLVLFSLQNFILKIFQSGYFIVFSYRSKSLFFTKNLREGRIGLLSKTSLRQFHSRANLLTITLSPVLTWDASRPRSTHKPTSGQEIGTDFGANISMAASYWE